MSDSPAAESNQIFADLSIEGGMLRARLTGPNIGQREGEVVSKMIESELAEKDSAVKLLVLDFSNVGFINSSGIGSCIAIRNNAKTLKKETALFGLTDQLRQAFVMTRMDKLFKMPDSEDKLAKLAR